MSKADRDKAVHKFQTDPSAQVFILSLKAGGVGLNLTAGNHVVHYDLW
jgi:SNF2 family DNA or RNA helicase